MKYRKKPVEIEAIQWTGDNLFECLNFLTENSNNDITHYGGTDTIIIHTLEGDMTASIGDYIIKGVNGEFYPCKPDIFEKTYEKVVEAKDIQTIGFKDDPIFLLSDEEYERYKDNIPLIRDRWWIRSPGLNSYDATYVTRNGDVDSDGSYVYFTDYAVRPALKPSLVLNLRDKNCGEWFDYLGHRWIKIDEDLYISEILIGYEIFDSIDSKSNDYKASRIREWLLNWLETRK